MNERFLSRGKRKDNGTWETGFLVITRYDCSDEQYFITDKMTGYHTPVIPETVGQCTGLKDKNGKLIFEGDIVEADGYIFFVNFGKCGGVANKVDYGYIGYYLDGYDEITKKALSYGLRDDICYFTNIEAIGNIHDNPELLKGCGGGMKMKCNNCKHLCDGWCDIIYDSPDPDIERECDSYKTRSNYDHIKQMSIDEMAECSMPFFGCPYDTPYVGCAMGKKYHDDCSKCIKAWLIQEVHGSDR